MIFEINLDLSDFQFLPVIFGPVLKILGPFHAMLAIATSTVLAAGDLLHSGPTVAVNAGTTNNFVHHFWCILNTVEQEHATTRAVFVNKVMRPFSKL